MLEEHKRPFLKTSECCAFFQMNAQHSEVVKKGLLCSSSTSRPCAKSSQNSEEFAFNSKISLFSVIFAEHKSQALRHKRYDFNEPTLMAERPEF